MLVYIIQTYLTCLYTNKKIDTFNGDTIDNYKTIARARDYNEPYYVYNISGFFFITRAYF